MTIRTILRRTTALAAIVVLPLAPAIVQAESAQATGSQPAAAGAQSQQAAQAQGDTQQEQGGATSDAAQAGQQTGQQTQQQTGQQKGQETQQQTGQQTGEQAGDQAAEAGPDMVVAKVGDSEIRRSDVLTVIGMLPPQLQQQPPEMLIPIALDQLVMRELILEKAKEAGLESDPAVTSLAEDASMRAKEDAMVQVWLENELGKAVTEEKVKETYETVKQQMGDQAPDVETLRPQIEQELRQQAFLDLSRDLQEGAEITLYGPDGQPVTQ